jgi:hypothetical protein
MDAKQRILVAAVLGQRPPWPPRSSAAAAPVLAAVQARAHGSGPAAISLASARAFVADAEHVISSMRRAAGGRLSVIGGAARPTSSGEGGGDGAIDGASDNAGDAHSDAETDAHSDGEHGRQDDARGAHSRLPLRRRRAAAGDSDEFPRPAARRPRRDEDADVAAADDADAAAADGSDAAAADGSDAAADDDPPPHAQADASQSSSSSDDDGFRRRRGRGRGRGRGAGRGRRSSSAHADARRANLIRARQARVERAAAAAVEEG